MLRLRFRIETILLVLIAAFVAGCGGDAPTRSDNRLGLDWRVTRQGDGMPLRSVAWSGSLYVAVGSLGTIRTSSDGDTWPNQVSGTIKALHDVAWCDSIFVAVGEQGTILTSPDGVTWANRSVSTGHALLAVTCSDRVIVAVGSGGTNWHSLTGGRTWLHVVSFTSKKVNDIAWHGGRWVACTDSGSIFHSTDAGSWIEVPTNIPSDASVVALVWTGYGFYAAANFRDTASGHPTCGLWRAAAGLHWDHNVTLEGQWNHCLAWDGSQVVAAGVRMPYGGRLRGTILSTANGSNWMDHPCDAPYDVFGVGAGNSQLVAVGYSGYILAGPSAAQMSIRSSGATFSSIIWNGTEFVAVTEQGTVLTSLDGTRWKEGLAEGASSFEFLLYSGQRYVGISRGSTSRIYVSNDASSWSQVAIPARLSFSVMDADWGNGTFVGVGDLGMVAFSSDGASWAVTTLGSGKPVHVLAFNGSEFVTFSDGSLYSSPDAVSWTATPMAHPVPTAITRLIWTGREYFALGRVTDSSGALVRTVLKSGDGLHWEDTEAPISTNMTGLRWSGERIIAYGFYGTVLTSRDGRDWTTLKLGEDFFFRDLAVAPNRLVLVGSDGTVLVSP